MTEQEGVYRNMGQSFMHPRLCILLLGKLVIYALSDKLFACMRRGGLFGPLLLAKEGFYVTSQLINLVNRKGV